MTRAGSVVAMLVVACTAACATAAWAQPAARSAPRGHGVEVSLGAALGGPAALGSAGADLIRPNGSSLTQFRTGTRFGAGVGGEVGVAAYFSRRAGIEATGYWLRHQVRTEITDDYEGAPSVTLTQPIYRMSVEGALVVMLTQGPRADVFVRAGGGWMQEVADGATLAETGTTATVGVGAKYWWRDRPLGRGTRIGLRMDARVLARNGGVTLGSRTWQFGPTGMAGLVFGF